MGFLIHAQDAANVPAALRKAIVSAISFFETTFEPEHNVYMNIAFKWAPLAGDGVGESRTAVPATPFANVVAALPQVDREIADDKGLKLPDTNPFGGSMNATNSQTAVMGLFSPDGSPSNTTLDSTITLNSHDSFTFDPSNGVAAGTFDAVGVLEHEISEVMGRQCGGSDGNLFPEPFALFRYDSSHQIDTSSGIGDYFSLNGTVSSMTLWGSRAAATSPTGIPPPAIVVVSL